MKKRIVSLLNSLVHQVEQGQRLGYIYGMGKLKAYKEIKSWLVAFAPRATDEGIAKFYLKNRWSIQLLLPSPAHTSYGTYKEQHFEIIRQIEKTKWNGQPLLSGDPVPDKPSQGYNHLPAQR